MQDAVWVCIINHITTRATIIDTIAADLKPVPSIGCLYHNIYVIWKTDLTAVYVI